MQVLIRFDTSDAKAFVAEYNDASERRDQTGLRQLQLWREDGGTSVWGLFEASDRAKVEDWLSSETGLRDSLTGTSAHFLRTA